MYVPDAPNVWEGFCAVDVVLSPKSHVQLTIVAVRGSLLVSVKFTVRPRRLEVERGRGGTVHRGAGAVP